MDDWYYVRCVHSDKVWDIEGASSDDYVRLCQYEFHGGWNQQFQFEENEDGKHYIKVRHSGKYIGIRQMDYPGEATPTAGKQLVQLSIDDTPQQFFLLDDSIFSV